MEDAIYVSGMQAFFAIVELEKHEESNVDVIIRSHILIVGVDRAVKQYDSNVGRVSYADVKSMPPTRSSFTVVGCAFRCWLSTMYSEYCTVYCMLLCSV